MYAYVLVACMRSSCRLPGRPPAVWRRRSAPALSRCLHAACPYDRKHVASPVAPHPAHRSTRRGCPLFPTDRPREDRPARDSTYVPLAGGPLHNAHRESSGARVGYVGYRSGEAGVHGKGAGVSGVRPGSPVRELGGQGCQPLVGVGGTISPIFWGRVGVGSPRSPALRRACRRTAHPVRRNLPN